MELTNEKPGYNISGVNELFPLLKQFMKKKNKYNIFRERRYNGRKIGKIMTLGADCTLDKVVVSDESGVEQSLHEDGGAFFHHICEQGPIYQVVFCFSPYIKDEENSITLARGENPKCKMNTETMRMRLSFERDNEQIEYSIAP